jgi:UDP-glucose 4-epimerase
MHHATIRGVHGTFNLAGDGLLVLSQALRRLGRPAVPVPSFALNAAGTVTRTGPLKGLEADLAGFLTFGRGLDTKRMYDVLGFSPAYTTAAALADFAGAGAHA